MNQDSILIQRIDSKELREIIPETARDERNKHLKNVGFFIKVLKNYVSAVCSFVSPYRESRKLIRQMIKNIFVYVKAKSKLVKKGIIRVFTKRL